MANDTTGGTDTVAATETSFTILESLGELRGAGVTELSRVLEMPKSTVHKHLHTLESIGYVRKEHNAYSLTEKFAELAQADHDPVSSFELMNAEVDKLATRLNELVGWHRSEGSVGRDVYRASSTIDGRTFENVPDLHATAPGKAILAEMDESEVHAVVEERGLPSITASTITDEADLFSELDLVRERGIAFERGEQDPDVRSVATSVTGADGETIGALFVAGPAGRFTGKQFVEHIPGMLLNTKSTIRKRTLE